MVWIVSVVIITISVWNMNECLAMCVLNVEMGIAAKCIENAGKIPSTQEREKKTTTTTAGDDEK